MALITAKKIHNGYNWLPERTIIDVADDGTIIGLYNYDSGLKPQFFEGVLVPGFVNAHCHLELSHLKGVVPEHTGLIPFLEAIPLHRNNFTEIQKYDARYAAHNELIKNGIVAVGDISNSTDTLDLRDLEKLHFHTFIESIGFADEKADKFFNNSIEKFEMFANQNTGFKTHKQSIVPHAPYSVSKDLFGLINGFNNNTVFSIHNQESEAEDLFFKHKTGKITDLLSKLGVDFINFKPSGNSSLQTYLKYISENKQIIFVHNTYSILEDIQFALQHFKNTFWCLCSNANLYIENRLPNIKMFYDHQLNICIGTDSLASNNQLSILSELKTIKKHFPEIQWDALIKWATINGAKALMFQNDIGSIEIGKKPGIVQIVGLEEDTDSECFVVK